MLDAFRWSGLCVALVVAVGCGKGGESNGAKGPGGGGTGGVPATGGGPTGLPSVPGEPDTTVKTALPPVPTFSGVTASTVGDSVSIKLSPVAGARDYRVYPMPADDAITVGDDGQVTIADAIYRCAGDRQAPTLVTDATPMMQSQAVKTIVVGEIDGFKREEADATLGYVYVNPGEGRVPVYALGDSATNGDNFCFHQRWAESRVKRYTTSETERADLLKKRWRDDGIAFYVPAEGTAGTRPVYTNDAKSPLFFIDGPEADKRTEDRAVFSALTEVGPADSVPLMRVYYVNGCGNSHDELVAGLPRFERARFQGDKQPLFDLHWSGITEETTLVVEALDVGCPFAGVLAAASKEAGKEDGIDYPPFLTLEDARAASATGEVFINGHHDSANKPKAIARSFIKVSPGPKPEMDWFTGFGPDEPLPDFASFTFTDPCEAPPNPNCQREYRQITDFADFSYNSATPNRSTLGVVLGELWVTYADVGADVGGKFRMTPNLKGKMTADTYLHVTMEIDNYTTSRRYPQIIISSGNAPVQWTIPDSNALIFQSFPDDGSNNWPFVNVIEVCDHFKWDVNNQCPYARLNKYENGDEKFLIPAPENYEHSGIDRSTRFDVFASTERAYVFVDSLPYSCLDLPDAGVPSGDVTVTFGDVMYHSGVDAVHAFHNAHQKIVAKRHLDNLGFKSGVPGPTWDAERFPCLPASAVGAQ